MAAFATVAQYEARFGAVEDRSLLAECLEDASAAIRAAFSKARVPLPDDPDEDLAYNLMSVCRSMANRLMPAGGGLAVPGVAQMGVTAGSYTEQYTFRDSYGTAKPLPSELDLLGLAGGRAGWAPLAGDDE